jgi:carboxynorspermidine decarboxylase
MELKTPYYLIDESKLLKNLEKIRYLKDTSGTKSLLALKCFSTWSVFNLMNKYMDGVTSSSPYEARLGYEKFGKEVQVYSVAYSIDDIKIIKKYADKIIFNSISQLKMFYNYVRKLKIGLRINPGVSYSDYDLADPCRKYSRLGVIDEKSIIEVVDLLSGVMFHFNCENDNFKNFCSNLDIISNKYGNLFRKLEWVSLGGGIYFTKDDYPLEKFCKKLKEFSKEFGVQVYLEPGETAVTQSTELVTKILDIIHNKINIAIVDASIEAHMLDLLVYRTNAKIKNSDKGQFKYMIAGRSCLAGDIFGIYNFKSPLKVGEIIRIDDAGGYTMVKKNWFNGLQMPSIVVKRLNGSLEIIRSFNYKDFVNNLS